MLFTDLKLHSWILKTIKDLKIKGMTDIQSKTIPLILKNKNVIGVSSTGSGKTLSFLIPIMNQLKLDQSIQSIIITPTRELARQIHSITNLFKKYEPKLKTQLLIGGKDYNQQIKNINNSRPQILICTVEKLKLALKNEDLNIDSLKYLTLDEADMLMDLGFFNDLDYIFKKIDNNELVKNAWSATLHELLSNQLSKYYKDTKIITIGKNIYENNKIKHYVIHNNDKMHALTTLLKAINPYLCIIFANKKQQVELIYKFLKKNNYEVIMIHGGLNSRERKNAYKNIQRQNYQFVVASDLASRGLDINGISHVISWDMPEDNEWYIHRAGRSGRGKYDGESWILSSTVNDDSKLLFFERKNIEFTHFVIKNNKLIKKQYNYQRKLNKLDKESNEKIKKIINQKNKVKPGYKKKMKNEINKIKRKSKHKYLDNKIKQKLIKQYKINNSKKT